MSEQTTKQDLRELEQRLDARIDQAIDRLDSSLKKHMHDVETRLLTAFHSYAQTNDIRLRKVESDLSNVNTAQTLRFDVMESRLLAVERKVHDIGRS